MSPRISVIEQEHSIGLTDKPREGLKMEGEGREIDFFIEPYKKIPSLSVQ